MPRLTAEAKIALEQTMRKAMRRAVIELARKRPLDDISIADIARHMKVSSVTVYNYYPNRADLIRDVFRQSRDGVYSKLHRAAVGGESPDVKLLRYAGIIFSDFAANENLFMARFASPPTDKNGSAEAKGQFNEIIDLFAAEIKEGIETGVFRFVDPASTAMMMCGAIMGVNRHCHFKWADMCLTERIDNFNELMIKGLIKK